MTKLLPVVPLLLAAAVAMPCSAAATCGGSPEPAAVVAAQVEAYNRHDVKAFLSCYADNATMYKLDGSKAPVQGTEALRKVFAFLEKIPADGAGYGVDIVVKATTGPTVANVERVRGQRPGAAPVPDTLVIYEVRDGKILNVWFAPAK